MNERNEETGKFEPRVSREDVLELFAGGEPMSTRQVADALGYTQAGAHELLSRFEDDGEIEKKQLAEFGGAAIWWRSADADGHEG